MGSLGPHKPPPQGTPKLGPLISPGAEATTLWCKFMVGCILIPVPTGTDRTAPLEVGAALCHHPKDVGAPSWHSWLRDIRVRMDPASGSAQTWRVAHEVLGGGVQQRFLGPGLPEGLASCGEPCIRSWPLFPPGSLVLLVGAPSILG